MIITTKPLWAIHDTFAWIGQHRIPTSEVHIKDAKWKVACDFYLDDGPHVIESLVRNRPEAIVCRFVRPWNHPVAGARGRSRLGRSLSTRSTGAAAVNAVGGIVTGLAGGIAPWPAPNIQGRT